MAQKQVVAVIIHTFLLAGLCVLLPEKYKYFQKPELRNCDI